MEGITARVAKLDDEKIYLGLGDPVSLPELKAGDFVFGDPSIKDALPEGAVWVERDCDLPPGRYRLTEPNERHKVWHFLPIEDALARTFDQMIELGIALAFSRFEDKGPLGRYAREFYALAAKNFPDIVGRHARSAVK